MTAPVLELVSVTAGYGDNPIVRDFSARLALGSITTLIGGNGAGKSTLLRAIYGTNRMFDGQIVFKGETIERLPPWERLKRGVGFVPQGRCNFPAMSVAENLKMGCYTLHAARHAAAIERVMSLFPMLRAKAKIDAGNLSGGEQQILEMAMQDREPEGRLEALEVRAAGHPPEASQEAAAVTRRGLPQASPLRFRDVDRRPPGRRTTFWVTRSTAGPANGPEVGFRDRRCP